MKTAKYGACLITFNEEDNIIAALESISFADEIIVVDSHSTDRTRELTFGFRGRSRDGKEVAPQVIERDWPGHVEQKNFAIDQAKNEWVLYLDVDERVSPRLRKEEAGGILIESCACSTRTEGAGAASIPMIT